MEVWSAEVMLGILLEATDRPGILDARRRDCWTRGLSVHDLQVTFDRKRRLPISRRNFVELCHTLTEPDEKCPRVW
jgi:hypothetical protein